MSSDSAAQMSLGEAGQEPTAEAVDSPTTVDSSAQENLAATTTAGDLMRQAREERGLHLETLASALKVPAKKIEALENNTFDELPDLAFARALAASVCRHLKIDSAPVLALLPQSRPTQLQAPQMGAALDSQVAPKLRTLSPMAPIVTRSLFKRPLWIAAAAFLGLAILLALKPQIFSQFFKPNPPLAEVQTPVGDTNDAGRELAPQNLQAANPAASGAAGSQTVAPTTASAAVVPSVAVPVPAASSALALQANSQLGTALPPQNLSTTGLNLNANSESWVQVTDASKRVLISRTLLPGEALALEGKAPYRLIVGRAEGVTIHHKGSPVSYPANMQTGLARFTVAAN